jgi:SAM-dependent methyltransferase
MQNSTWTPPELLKMSGSYWEACALHAGVKLDLFTPLAKTPATAAELAVRLGLDSRGLAMLLDALAALELLTKEGASYQATPFAAQFLAVDSAAYLGHIIQHHHHLVDSWARLDQAVRTGEPSRRRVSHDSEEVERESFLLGMFNLAMLLAPRVVRQIDLSGRKHLLDLGGGPGTYAIHFCQQNPDLRATVFDLPTTRPIAEKTIDTFSLQERINFVAGDFQEDTLCGSYDVAWLSHVLHGEGEADCARMLKKAAGVLEPGGVLLVQEFILEDSRDRPLFPALFSLNMLLGTPQGKAYSTGEIKALLTTAGLEKIERLPMDLPNGAGVIGGRKPGEPV